ncbi:GNAT family N-acetyltransferase [Actinokineospora pegani]|uniref:GNAT family N-acetyltransferase n=1 Tax=Actinokineospora pegani TaxID=2654637 RepID=UPI0012EAE9A1|nr:GNAT family N-acetyltransferase [Actinokineospora pegani]
MDLRAVTDQDWGRVWPFMREIIAAGQTYTLATDLTEAEARAMWLIPTALVAVAGDTVLGIGKFHANHGGNADHIANGSFMVDPAHAGKGVGRALGARVLDEARAAGFTAMQFNAVVSTNTAAVRLWRSLGFEVVATLPGGFRHPVHGPVGLHIMYREL